MTKKEKYLKPAMEAEQIDTGLHLMVESVQSSGLGNELSQDDTPGDSWNDAMSRGSVWDDGEW